MYRNKICQRSLQATSILLAFLWTSSASSETEALQRIRLTTIEQTPVSLAGAIVAEKMSLFERNGIAVVITEGKPEQALQDETEPSIYLLPARRFLQLRSRGARIIAVAANQSDAPIRLWFKDSKEHPTADSLKNKTIAYDPDTDAGVALDWLLQKARISRATITEVTYTYSSAETPAAVLVSSVGNDDSVTRQFILEARRGHSVLKWLDPRSAGVHLPGSVYATAERMLVNKPELISKFLKSLIAGWEAVYSDTVSAAATISTASSNLTNSDLQLALEEQRDYVRPLGQRFGDLSRLKIGNLYSFLLHRRLLDRTIDLAAAIDERPLIRAYRESREPY